MDKSCFFCGLIGIIINSILGLTKLIIGIFSNSITIIIDAYNNIIDMISSIILLILKKDYLSSLLITFLMLFMSIFFIYNSIHKIIYLDNLCFDIYTIIILINTLLFKIIQYFIYKKLYLKSKFKSINVILIETKNDIITSISILISILFMFYLNINIDGYIGLCISIYILFDNIRVLKKILKSKKN